MISRVCAKARAGFLSSLAAAGGSALSVSTALGATALVPGQAPFNQPVCCTPRATLPGEGGDSGAEADRALAADLIQRTAFAMLPPEQQARLVAAGAVSGDVASLPPEVASMPPLGDEGYAVVRRIVQREVFDRMLPVHQRALVKLMEDQATGETPRMLCFAPTTDQDVVDAFNRAAFSPFNSRFQQGNRWSTTATNTTPTGQGDRVTLRYSFVPDGTSVPNLSADAATSGATSNLFAFLNTIYGSPAVWQPIYQQVFTRWSGLIGVNYVLEANDDGVPIATGNAGAVGVRGDLRLAGTTLDGASNVLAFNYFPGAGVGGDMVIDTADTFFNTITGSSIRLRNVLAHEHGHGLGMAHVCPVNNTKLMEPFVSVAYDGPQFDDILNGQRHYGDPIEPNDSIATAFNVGTVDATSRQVGQLLSIDDGADVDVFRFDVPAAGVLTVVALPQGTSYLDGPQNSNGSCSAGTPFDALRVNTLSATGLNSGGATLQSVAASSPGTSASLALVCPSPGTYYVRIGGGQVSNIQAYRLLYSLATVPSVIITATTPTLVSPSDPTSFGVQIQVVNDTLAPGSAQLFFRSTPSAAFQSVELAPVVGTPGSFTATLPAFACDSSPAFYLSASSTSGTSSTFPAGGPAAPRTARVGATTFGVFSDDFETDTGWTYGVAGDTATTGIWLRAVPVGTTAQPGATTSGTRCAVTGNATAGAALGTNDVDTGFTTLLSPRFDLTGAVAARVSYQRWYTNNLGNAPNTKVFAVDISSDDGATWTRAETVGPASPAAAWIASGFDVPGSLGFTANMRVRFLADDTGTGSLVEAAVDDFAVTAVRCVSVPPPCPADFDVSGTRDVSDIFAFLSAWFASGPGSDFDQSGTRDVSDIFAFLSAWFAGC